MKQAKDEIVAGYANPDPWGYQTNRDDIERKRRIIEAVKFYCQGYENYIDPTTKELKQRKKGYERALDICCGEGWITGDLPAKEIEGIELSEKARARFPKNVKAVNEPRGNYDLVVLTGALYKHYDWETFVGWINAAARQYIVLSNIKDWEVSDAIKQIKATQLVWYTFPYREYEQILRVFKV